MMGPPVSQEYEEMEARIAKRIETCNKRFNNWGGRLEEESFTILYISMDLVSEQYLF